MPPNTLFHLFLILHLAYHIHNSFPFYLRLTSDVKTRTPASFFQGEVRISSFFGTIHCIDGSKPEVGRSNPPNPPGKSDPASHFELYFNSFLAFSLLYYTAYYAHFFLYSFFIPSADTFHTFSHNTQTSVLTEGELRGSGSRTVGVKNRPPQPFF